MYLTFIIVNYTDVFITSFSVREKSLHHLDTFNTILTGIREQESDAKRRPRLLFKQRPNKAASSRGRKRSWKQKKSIFKPSKVMELSNAHFSKSVFTNHDSSPTSGPSLNMSIDVTLHFPLD